MSDLRCIVITAALMVSSCGVQIDHHESEYISERQSDAIIDRDLSERLEAFANENGYSHYCKEPLCGEISYSFSIRSWRTMTTVLRSEFDDGGYTYVVMANSRWARAQQTLEMGRAVDQIVGEVIESQRGERP